MATHPSTLARSYRPWDRQAPPNPLEAIAPARAPPSVGTTTQPPTRSSSTVRGDGHLPPFMLTQAPPHELVIVAWTAPPPPVADANSPSLDPAVVEEDQLPPSR